MNNERFMVRVWDTCLNKMISHPVFIQGDDGNFFEMLYKTGSLYPSEKISPDRFIKMQCTGIRDTENNLIWEGDILEINDKNGHVRPPCEVIFHQPIVAYAIKFKHGEKAFIVDCIFRLVDSCEFKVIGNIYEDPEFLEQLK